MRPNYGDHLLASHGIKLIAGAKRGRNFPAGMALTDLRPTNVLKPGERQIRGKQMQDRVLDESGPYVASWGRDLMWRILEDIGGEGDVFLKTIDPGHYNYYMFPGDRDLQDSRGDQVMLYIRWCRRRWLWYEGDVNNGVYCATDQVFTLVNPLS